MKAPAAGLPNGHQERTVDNVDEEALFAVTVEVAQPEEAVGAAGSSAQEHRARRQTCQRNN